MLLLVTILLVVVGTISLVIGFVQSSLLPIYISIACSVLAAVVLLIFSRMTAKSQQVATADGGPAPLDLGREPSDREREPAFVGTGLLAGSSGGESFAQDAGDGAGTSHDGIADDDEMPEPADDDFPIERYDQRRVGEILPLLAELNLDELDIVREHEEQGKSRATVLARIDQLIDQLEAEDRAEEASRFDQDDTAAVGVVDTGASSGGDGMDLDVEDRAPIDLAPVAPPPPTQAVSVAALPDDDGYFPIEDYEDLRASEILPLLPELDDDELVMVQQRESGGPARSSILRRIDALLVTSDTDAGPPGAVEPEPQPEAVPDDDLFPFVASEAPGDGLTKKAAPKRAPAGRKAPARKVPAAKAPAVKLPAAKAPAVKKAAAAAPVKKAPAKRGTTGKVSAVLEKSGTINAPAKKAGAVSVKKAGTATAAKASTAKKAPTGKVAAARAAAATKGGGTASAAKAAKATRRTTKG